LLQIGEQKIKPLTFSVRSPSQHELAIAQAALPKTFGRVSPREIEFTLRAADDFLDFADSEKVWWNNIFVGWFSRREISQRWDGDRYRTTISLIEVRQSDRTANVPRILWRHDLDAIAQGYPETSGAMLIAGRQIEKIPPSWKREILI
jgi:hypothetical protein